MSLEDGLIVEDLVLVWVWSLAMELKEELVGIKRLMGGRDGKKVSQSDFGQHGRGMRRLEMLIVGFFL